ncbi:glycosyltransferase family 2 protein [Chloroflexota bacterium]
MISIIIPTYNRAKVLREAIESTFEQSYSDFEIIVVDNGPSTDNTKEMVESFVKRDGRITYISTKLKGCIFARNIGVKAANGEIILTIDDDIEFIKGDELAILVETYRRDDRIAIVGGIELNKRDEIVEKSVDTLPYNVGRISQKGEFNTSFKLIEGHGITEVDHMRSAFMGIKKEAFEQVRGFDEVYDAKGLGFRYESDLCLKVKGAGYKIVVNPEIKIWHKNTTRPRGFRRGEGFNYFYYANRNHVYFMNRFFWFGNLASFFKDLIWGSYRTPGIGLFLRRSITNINITFIISAFASVIGKVEGYRRWYLNEHK